jgi:2-haloalkanoic acid dehalogenase type II
MAPPRPRLLTFDLFGTVIDWREGLRSAVRAHGIDLTEGQFEAVIDAQGEDEQVAFRPYVEIVERSLVRVLGMDASAARATGERAGEWPVFPDAPAAIRRLLELAPCGATTNSDLSHRPAIEAQLGCRMTHWICAEAVGAYKPDPKIWQAAAREADVDYGQGWWHVSAYADYDLATARELGLTTVLVERPHHRPGAPADVDLWVSDLSALVEVAASGSFR